MFIFQPVHQQRFGKAKSKVSSVQCYSVLDLFVVHIHCNLPFKCILMLLPFQRIYIILYLHPIFESVCQYHPIIYLIHLLIKRCISFQYYGMYPFSIRLLLSYHTSFYCFSSIPFSSFDTMCNTRRRRAYVVIYSKHLISKL